MKIFALETSCDETSWCVVEFSENHPNQFKILSWKNKTQTSHEKFGGVIPELASREHLDFLQQYLEELRSLIKDIDLIAVTCGPGLKGSLLAGVTFCRALSVSFKKPLIGVDHVEAHLYSPCIFSRDFPFLGCVFSGGHTLIAVANSTLDYKIISSTVDDAVGEAFDKCGVLLGLKYPSGPKLAQLADKYEGTDLFDLPIPMKNQLNFSFSGFKTAVKRLICEFDDLSDDLRIKIAASIQDKLIDALIFKINQASALTKIKTVGLSGGVAQNKSLRKKLAKCFDQLIIPPPELCSDNAIIIAFRAFQMLKGGKSGLFKTSIFDTKLYR